MSTSQDTFSKGDWIVHANYGIGQIKAKETKVLEQEKQAFYRVKTFDGVYWLPALDREAPIEKLDLKGWQMIYPG